MEITDYLGYVIATATSVACTTGARLYRTGQMKALSDSHPISTLCLTLLYGASTFTAFFYFSWAYLNWQQIALFFVILITAGDWLARQNSLRVVLGSFIASTLGCGIGELAFLYLA